VVTPFFSSTMDAFDVCFLCVQNQHLQLNTAKY